MIIFGGSPPNTGFPLFLVLQRIYHYGSRYPSAGVSAIIRQRGSIGVANSGLTKQNEAPVGVLPAFRFVLPKARERCEFAERSTLAPQEILSIKLRPYGGCF